MDFLPTLSRMSFEERRSRRVFLWEEPLKDSFISFFQQVRVQLLADSAYLRSPYSIVARIKSDFLSLSHTKQNVDTARLCRRAQHVYPHCDMNLDWGPKKSIISPSSIFERGQKIKSLPFLSRHRELLISHNMSLILCVFIILTSYANKIKFEF